MCPLAAGSGAFVALVNSVLLEGMPFISKRDQPVKCFHSNGGEKVMSGIDLSW